MINYTVLLKDGILFEQLIRELFIANKFETFWTGVGPDGGRDLVVIERLKGPLSQTERRWLVSCKNFATANKAVGVNDIINITDAIKAINANGFILACSTYPSSSLVKRLDELLISQNIPYKILDGIEIEKMLLRPHTFYLLKTFFPLDERNKNWQIFSTEDIGVWMASYRGHFFFYSSRDRIVAPPLEPIEFIIEIYNDLLQDIINNVREIVKNKNFHIVFRYRGFYYDDKHCTYLIYLDCQVEKSELKDIEAVIKGFFSDKYSVLSEGDRYANIANIDLQFSYPSFFSDHYHEDHHEYYNPFYESFKKGKKRWLDNLVW